jgi:putative endonuclease
MSYYVYILRCDDGSYYTGYTKDVDHRIKQHRQGRGARYTRMHEPDDVVYVEAVGSRGEAMKREREIKSLSHSEKKKLARTQSGFDT